MLTPFLRDLVRSVAVAVVATAAAHFTGVAAFVHDMGGPSAVVAAGGMVVGGVVSWLHRERSTRPLTAGPRAPVSKRTRGGPPLPPDVPRPVPPPMR